MSWAASYPSSLTGHLNLPTINSPPNFRTPVRVVGRYLVSSLFGDTGMHKSAYIKEPGRPKLSCTECTRRKQKVSFVAPEACS
jgi:hypothetical protein